MIGNLATLLDRLKKFFLIRIGCEYPFHIVQHPEHRPDEVCVLCQNNGRSWLTIPTKNIFFDRVGGWQTSFEDLEYFPHLVRNLSLRIIYRMGVGPGWNIPVSIHHDLLGGIDHRLRNPLDSKRLAG